MGSQTPSNEQFETLVEFMETHDNFAAERLKSIATQRQATELWKELAFKLNSIGIVNKTPEKWRLYYNDWKYRVKKRSAGLKSPKCALTDVEERLLRLAVPNYTKSDDIAQLDPFQTIDQSDVPTIFEEDQFLKFNIQGPQAVVVEVPSEGGIATSHSVVVEIPPKGPLVARRRRNRNTSPTTNADKSVRQSSPSNLDKYGKLLIEAERKRLKTEEGNNSSQRTFLMSIQQEVGKLRSSTENNNVLLQRQTVILERRNQILERHQALQERQHAMFERQTVAMEQLVKLVQQFVEKK